MHTADASADYTKGRNYVTSFISNEGHYSEFKIDDKDLYAIQTYKPISGFIELRRLTASSGYIKENLNTPTAFAYSERLNGTWTIDRADLYLIKTFNTASGHIEVIRASHKHYRAIDLHQVTALPQTEARRGTWTIYNGDLFFIKWRATRFSNVEVHRLTASTNFRAECTYQSGFTLSEAADGRGGFWDIGANGDLYFVKTANNASGRIEVHIATASSLYTTIRRYETWISDKDQNNGIWITN